MIRTLTVVVALATTLAPRLAGAYEQAHLDTLFATGNCVGCDLDLAPLAGVDLSGADLSNTRLRSANLEDANLSGATLVGADLRGINAEKANFAGAQITGARLDQANFEAANLKQANLSWSGGRELRMRGANLERATAFATILRNSDLASLKASGLIIPHGDLGGSDLYNADLSGAAMNAVALEQTLFRSTNLTSANMTSVDLTSVGSLEYVTIVDATLVFANVELIDFRDWNMSGVDLRHARTKGADFRRTNLSDANLTELDWSKRTFSDTVFDRAIVTGLDLRGAVMTRASLRDTDLTDVLLDAATHWNENDLSGVFCESCQWQAFSLFKPTLTGAHLADVDLNGGEILYAVLDDADLSGAQMIGATLSASSALFLDASGLDIREGTLAGEFASASFANAVANGASFHSGSNFKGSNLSGFSCISCHLPRLFEDTDLTGATLSKSTTAGNMLVIRGGVGEGLDLSDLSTGTLELNDIALPGATLTGLELEIGDTAVAFIDANLVGANYVAPDGRVGYCRTTTTGGSLVTKWHGDGFWLGAFGTCETGRGIDIDVGRGR